jgi:hypothetical protein
VGLSVVIGEKKLSKSDIVCLFKRKLTGLVHRNHSAPLPPPPFVPIGFAFRNKSAIGNAITHVAVWDATSSMLENDRITRCNVTVMPAKLSAVTPKALAAPAESAKLVSASHEDVTDRESPLRRRSSRALTIMLPNGTIALATAVPGREKEPIFPTARGQAVRFSVDLFDVPLLLAREDAIPPFKEFA